LLAIRHFLEVAAKINDIGVSSGGHKKRRAAGSTSTNRAAIRDQLMDTPQMIDAERGLDIWPTG